MNSHQVIIAIDPDCEKSGIALLSEGVDIMLQSMLFPDLVNLLLEASEDGAIKSTVVVEAGWLNKSNWHLNSNDSKAVAAAKGNAVGRNHETGRKIVEMAKYYGLEVIEVKPLSKIWSSKDGKISHAEIAYFIPNFPNRSNQETRDAALIAWNYANYPITRNCKL